MTELGVLFDTDRLTGPELIDHAHRLERIGIESLWLPELFGREPFATAGALLAVTSSLRVGSAIANIYARDPYATAAAARTLAELSGGRFELGLGVSNPGLNERRGHTWTDPAARLAGYLDAIRGADLTGPVGEFPIHVAAHGPKMLAAVEGRADGVFTYLMTPDHTAATRDRLGPEAAINPMLLCLLCPDPGEGRRLARRAIGYYVGLDYYRRAWRRLGFADDDFTGGGSDDLVDAVVAWGSIDAIRGRLSAQARSGATRVVVIPLNPAGGGRPDWALLEQLGED